MKSFSFSLPPDFADYEWEVTSKGWFSDARITVSGQTYRLSFYDAARLSQEIEAELEDAGVFCEPNLVILRAVTRLDMEKAVEHLVQSGRVSFLMPE